MNLSLPKGYVPPENAQAGEPFEAVATIKANGDGSFTLLTIDGAKLGDGEEEEVAEEGDKKAMFAKKVQLPWEQEPAY